MMDAERLETDREFIEAVSPLVTCAVCGQHVNICECPCQGDSHDS